MSGAAQGRALEKTLKPFAGKDVGNVGAENNNQRRTSLVMRNTLAASRISSDKPCGSVVT
ncbi:hypothetical protein ABGN05_17810 [Aquibium sp. LZ166]|uniref:Uncharacterized protein n=1 Tax=Aquibium pacificus TaxID=3153579 RepID=A0ABV3SL57_9HYPH